VLDDNGEAFKQNCCMLLLKCWPEGFKRADERPVWGLMLKDDDGGRLLWLVEGAEYRRVFGLLLVAGFGEDGGARESFSASDNSAMLRL